MNHLRDIALHSIRSIKPSIHIASGLLLLVASNYVAAACTTSSTQTSSSMGRFLDHNDGTITDIETGLMWSKCIHGMSGTTCGTGGPTTNHIYNWQTALSTARFANDFGYNDWRLPNIKELISLIDEQCQNPAINPAVFPGSPSSSIWSSTPYSANPANAWYVSFGDGGDSNLRKTTSFNIRLVRDARANYRHLVNTQGRCAGLSGTPANGTNVRLENCSSSADDQKWWYDPQTKRFHNAANTLFCLDHEGAASATNSGAVKLWSCADSDNQRWDWVNDTIRNRHDSNFVMAASSNTNNANIHQWAYSSSDLNQRWTQAAQGSSTAQYYELRDRRSNKCMDIAGGTMANNTNVQLWDCADVSHQRWWFDPSTARIHSEKDPNFCLDHEGAGSASNGGAVKIYTCANSDNQRWDYEGGAIRNRHNNNFVIDANGTNNGANITQWTSSNASQQQWVFVSP